MDNKPFAAVVDIETTGLEANYDVPLELGISIINVEGDVLAESDPWLVWEEGDTFQTGVARGRANEFVRNMHTKSGLWDDLDDIKHSKLGEYSRARVDYWASNFVGQFAEPGTLPMMGNSIGSLDRPFALIHFPRLNVALSYRNIDISTIRLLAAGNNPPLYEAMKAEIDDHFARGGESDHRVMSDIGHCIYEYKVYRDNFFYLNED